MVTASPLPQFLVDRYRAWRSSLDAGARAKLADLARNGQTPRAMIVACCDSRVMATDVFGGEAGEFFVHRNIASLVPPLNPASGARATTATVEYAVTVLKIQHLIIMGHYGCGGVAGCYDLNAGNPGAPDPASFVGMWLRVLTPGYRRVAARGLPRDEALHALEREGVILSLENLMTFPFVSSAVEAGRLQLHGIWKDISDGEMEIYDAATGAFHPL